MTDLFNKFFNPFMYKVMVDAAKTVLSISWKHNTARLMLNINLKETSKQEVCLLTHKCVNTRAKEDMCSTERRND